MYQPECIKVILDNLPPRIHAVAVYDGIDFYTIALNVNLNFEMQREAYLHELSHIIGEDFTKIQHPDSDMRDDTDVDEIEKKRHK